MEMKKGARELVFIDASIHEHDVIRGGLRPGVKAITIHPNEDGVERITQSLAAESNIQAIHIISHGQPGSLHLGLGAINIENLKTNLAAIHSWTKALAKGSELLLYGCNVAAGSLGVSFVDTFSSWLGIPVAASTQRVGAAQLGGTWDFDYQTGRVVTPNVIRPETRATYQGAFPQNTLYGSDVGGNIYEVNIATGVVELIGTIPGTFAISRGAETGRIFSIGNNANSDLVSSFDPVTQTTNTVGTTGVSGTFFKLAQSSSGAIFGIRSTNSELISFNRDTGIGTDLGTIVGLPTSSGDMAFNPSNPDQLIVLVTQTSPTAVYDLYSVDISDLNNLNAVLLGSIVNQAGNTLTPGGGSGTLAFGPDGNLYVTSRDNGTTTVAEDALFQIPVTNGVLPTGTITANFINVLENTAGQSIELTDFATLPIPTPVTNLNDPLAIDVTIDDGLTTADPNQSITYTITVTNPNDVAVPVQIQDFFPPSILQNPTFTASIPAASGFLADPNDIGTDIAVTANTAVETLLFANQSFTIALTGTVDPGITNTTTISTSVTATIVEDFVDLNNVVPLTPLVTDADIDNDTVIPGAIGPTVDIAVITNTDQARTITPGEDTTYTVQVRNNSSQPVQDIRIVNEIPEFLRPNARYQVTIPPGTGSFVDQTDASGSGDIDFEVNLNGGAIATITIDGRIRNNAPVDSIIINTATATLPPGITDDNPANNTRSDRTRIVADGPGSDDDCSRLGQTFNGKEGVNDVISATAGSDTILGVSGDDVLRGLGCPDDIFGGQGNDSLFGNERRDVIQGNQGDDDARGGKGPDVINGGLGNDKVKAGSQDDRVRGRRGNDTIEGNQGNDRLLGDSGDDIVFGNEGRDRLFGGLNNDILRSGKGPDRVNGGLGDDEIRAGSQDDKVHGRQGNDAINGDQGNDRIKGGDGDDIVQGNSGRDRAFGGLGADFVQGGAGNDFVQAGPGADIASGGAGNDRIIAGLGDDTAFGKKGDDLIFGRRGDDAINGGTGNDVVNGGIGNDNVRGSRGEDDLNGGQNDDKVIAGPGNDFSRGGSGNDTMRGNNGNDTLIMGRGNDAGFGGRNNDLVRGQQGNDFVSGNGGSDTVTGGTGDDRVLGGAGNDTVQGNQNNDLINGNRGNDFVNGGLGDDIIRGGAGQDFLRGGRGDDIIRGNAGADTLVGGLGEDILFGGGGRNTFVYQTANDGVDTIRDLNVSRDRIDVSAITTSLNNIRVRRFAGSSSVVQVNAGGGFEDLVVLEGIARSAVSSDVFVV
jgi:uncharacterized repeat protein (TIGR01451 family)